MPRPESHSLCPLPLLNQTSLNLVQGHSPDMVFSSHLNGFRRRSDILPNLVVAIDVCGFTNSIKEQRQ